MLHLPNTTCCSVRNEIMMDIFEMAEYVKNYQLLMYGQLPQSLHLIWFYFNTLQFFGHIHMLMCSV